MAILSVSLPPDLEAFIESEIASGRFETKSQVVKRALRNFMEYSLENRILEASKEAHNGKVYRGKIELPRRNKKHR